MSTDRYRHPKDVGMVLLPGARIRITASPQGVRFAVEKALMETVWVTAPDVTVAWGAFSGATGSLFGGAQQFRQLESWHKVQEFLAPNELALWHLTKSTAGQLDDARLGKLVKLLDQAWVVVVDMRRVSVDYEPVETRELPAPPPPRLELRRPS